MYGIIRRVILSGIDIQRGVLDYAEQAIEKGLSGMEAGERPLEHLVARVRQNKDYLEDTVRDLVEKALHIGLYQLDSKLSELNERISALEKKKTTSEPCPTRHTAKAHKPGAKSRKSTTKIRKKSPKPEVPPPVYEEPIIDG